jgi:hypothetical protein
MNQFDPHHFIFQLPLYSKIRFGTNSEKDFINLMTFAGTIDEYSPTLKENTTYKAVSNPGQSSNTYPRAIRHFLGINLIVLNCLRTQSDMSVFIHTYIDESDVFVLEKIGQSPSLADMQIAKLKEYHIVLNNDKLKELSKAVGLAAHGVGIGSFVYLRRIFEFLIEEAHVEAKKQSGWDETAYTGRVGEKITQLSHYLPEFLVENKSLYGILSKGIHELTEDECLLNFDIVKVGIEFILDEKLEKALKVKKIEEAKRRIQATSSGLK